MEVKMQNKSAVIVQSFVRMVLARKKFLQTRNSVIQIQACARGYLCRQTIQEKQTAMLNIQSWWRNVLLTRKVQNAYQNTRQNIITVQSQVRKFIAQRRFSRICQAVIILQKVTRGMLQRKKYIELKTATKTIQYHWKNHQLSKEVRTDYLLKKSSATKIASWWKMLRERKSFAMLKKSSVIIQKNIRMFQQRNRYLGIKSSVITIQKLWRAFKVMENLRGQFLLQKSSATRISSWWRMLSM